MKYLYLEAQNGIWKPEMKKISSEEMAQYSMKAERRALKSYYGRSETEETMVK